MDTSLDSGALLCDDRPPSPARNAPSPTLSARDPSPPLSPLLMTASPTREQSALSPVLLIHPSTFLLASHLPLSPPMLRSTKSLSRRRRARLIKRPPIFFCLSFARAYSQSTLFRRPTPQAWLVRFLCLLLPPLLLFPWWQPLLPTAPSSLPPGPLSPLLLLLVSTSCLYLLSRGVSTILSCRRPGRPQSRRSRSSRRRGPSQICRGTVPHRRPGSAPSRGR